MSETKKPFSEDVYENVKAQSIFLPLNSAEDLKNWMQLYFDIKFPQGVVYPTSTHGPVDAMWRIYELVKTGENINVPEVVMRASRDSGKSLSAAALEVLCMIHFRISVCHMAAISSQSQKTVQYVELFFRKIRPYLEYHGWSQTSDNQRMIEWIDETGQNLYLKIVIATIAGANSEHVPLLFCVDGKTKIPVRNNKNNPYDKGRNRYRKNKTARGIYQEFKKGKQVEVLSFNHDKNLLEFKLCLGVKKTKKPIYRVSFDGGKTLDITKDHKVYILGKGYVPLEYVSVGDSMININKMQTNKEPYYDIKSRKVSLLEVGESPDTFNEMLIGSLLGDGCVYRKNPEKYKNNAGFSENHCVEQEEYLKWKHSVFTDNGFKAVISKNSRSGFTQREQVSLLSGNSKRLNKWTDFKKTFHLSGVLENMGPLALAVWYQDDGNAHGFRLNTQGFTLEQNEYLSNLINRKFGMNTWIGWENKKDGRSFPYISGKVEDKYKLYKTCGHLFHQSMRFKLRDIEQTTVKKCRYCQDEFLTIETSTVAVCCSDSLCQSILKERLKPLPIKSIKYLKTDDVFDIAVADNHNFIANGMLVHNCDEVDTVSSAQVLNEAKMIPSSFKQYQPLMVYLSTLKFSGGLMEQTMESVRKAGGEIYSWNILDITEKIPDDVARVDEPKVVRYITSNLPMSNISPEEFSQLKEDDKLKYERFEAYAGIATHPMLPVMKNYLVDRPDGDHGGMYKKLSQTHNLFKKLPEDMANAQLLCLKPSSSNLVYPRFDEEANVVSMHELYEKVTGNEAPEDLSLEELRQALVSSDMEFIGGADWGYTDFTSLVVIMITPSQDAYILDHYLAEQIEFDDVTVAMGELERAWGIDRWYVDQAEPDKIATLRRKKFKVPSFTKVVGDGLSAVQYMICDATGRRRLFVLNSPNTQEIISSFGKYRWAVDGKGDPIGGKPYHGRDNGGISDIQDSIRYPFQVLFSKSGKKPTATVATQAKPERITFGASAEEIKQAHSNQLMSHVHGGNIPKPITHTHSTPQAPENTGQKKKKGVFWSI